MPPDFQFYLVTRHTPPPLPWRCRRHIVCISLLSILILAVSSSCLGKGARGFSCKGRKIVRLDLFFVCNNFFWRFMITVCKFTNLYFHAIMHASERSSAVLCIVASVLTGPIPRSLSAACKQSDSVAHYCYPDSRFPLYISSELGL